VARRGSYRWRGFGAEARTPAPVRKKKVKPSRGPKPPTPAQVKYLKALCARAGERVPKVKTRAEASLAIEGLLERLPKPSNEQAKPEPPEFV
jgi:hypothetical protein